MPYFQWLRDSPTSPLHAVQQHLRLAANISLPVLILGETGVGKELIARKLHSLGNRRTGPFIAVNCGSLSASLLESTLFGAVRGAYTGANADSMGMIRAAEQGTLFLDEIGELPLEAQSRLLRVLQEKSVMPVGSHREIPVDFRLICATHRNLREQVSRAHFREDLFYRICAFPIEIPPLRHRPQDIEPLARAIWFEILGNTTTLPSTQILSQYSWPGNIRQLRNILERFAALQCTGISLAEILHEECTQRHVRDLSPPQYRVRPTLARESIQTALELCGNNKTRTAQSLGISRGSLCYQLRKFGLAPTLKPVG